MEACAGGVASGAGGKMLKDEALEQLASIELIELCNEAKIEYCRATRDLRSCGRYVEHVLNPCGHASLCAECSQRCDNCPICRTTIQKNGTRLRTRLYNKCLESGLISKKYDDRFQEKDSALKQLTADVQRLYSLFDVALENNLISLVCHYITDVCMDEDAVSSDPVLAFLLDEVVIKDWCARSFGNIVEELRQIYKQGRGDMNKKTCSLLKYLSQLSGIANVLETVESSFKGTHTTQLHDVHCLLENVLRAKQHLEIMIWCIRHDFLESIPSRYQDSASWHSNVHNRKSAATERSWPNFISISSQESSGHGGPTLFIEDALSNLGLEYEEMGEELLVTCLQKDGKSTMQFTCKIGMAGCCYPFENFRVAADVLFLRGSSDLVVAKRAIFLYYMFDRHWTVPDTHWRHLVDDFAATFGITRHCLQESLTFYLLDDHTEEALKEACDLLSDIAGPETHPKVAQVLLERHQPDSALIILRCCGLDGIHAYATAGKMASLAEAVTAVRVRIDCGLLTEASMYQRTHCMKMKEQKSKYVHSTASMDNSNCDIWLEHMEVLVTEICRLCLRRNLVDRLIEFPWNSDEGNFLHKCLYESAYEDPSTTAGSLLVVFYLQRYRYVEAYEIHQKLQKLENNYIAKGTSDEVKSRMRSTSQWRATLIDRSLELLPEVQHQHVKSGLFLNTSHFLHEVENLHNIVDSSGDRQPNSKSLVPSSYCDSSIVLGINLSSLQSVEASASCSKPALIRKPSLGISDHQSPSILYGRHLHSNGVPSVYHLPASDMNSIKNYPFSNQWNHIGSSQDFRSGKETSILRNFPINSQSTPLKELNQSALRVPHHFQLDTSSFYMEKVGVEPRGPIICTENTYPADIQDNESKSPNIFDVRKYSSHDQTLTASGKRMPSDRPWISGPAENSTEFRWSHFTKGGSSFDSVPLTEGLRWRSDETSDDEQDQSPASILHGASTVSSVKVVRSRLSRR